jgi:ribosome maturation factor RimP
MAGSERVRAIVAPLVAERGLDLYDLEHRSGQVTVLVDRSGGVDLEVLSELTRAVSRALDEHDPIPGKYTLEVSSPGLERPLRRPEHYRSAQGEVITVKTQPSVEGDRRVRGTLTEVDDSGITVDPDDGPARRLAYDDIERARTVFEWGPAEQQRTKQAKKTKKADKKALSR